MPVADISTFRKSPLFELTKNGGYQRYYWCRKSTCCICESLSQMRNFTNITNVLSFCDICMIGCTGSCQYNNFWCSKWCKFCQNDDILVSVFIYRLSITIARTLSNISIAITFFFVICFSLCCHPLYLHANCQIVGMVYSYRIIAFYAFLNTNWHNSCHLNRSDILTVTGSVLGIYKMNKASEVSVCPWLVSLYSWWINH